MRHVICAVFVVAWIATGCAAEHADAPDTAAGDAGTLAAALSCAPTATTACDGNDVLSCADGAQHRQPCGLDAYCNFGACVAATIHLPADAQPHANNSEWWYYTGHLTSGDHHWGFEVTVFQYDMAFLTQQPGLGYMCHVAVVDKDIKEHYQTETLSFAPQIWTVAPLVLEVDNCHLELGGDGHDHIRGQIPKGMEKDQKADPWLIDLSLDPKKRATFHGGNGIIPMSANAGTSWYYSYTRLGATGTLSTPTGSFAVTGQAWMDHQWGDFSVEDFKGWDWWSTQFDDGYEIMLFQFTDWNGKLASQAGTIVDPQGNATALSGLDSFGVKSLRTWASPHTDGIYPMDWDIAIPQMAWQFAVRTSVDDQEMVNPAKNYWEGETTLHGTRGGVPVTGVGYTELTGYATNFLDPHKP